MTQSTAARMRYVPVIGARLRQLLFFVVALTATLAVNALYLGGVTLYEWYTQETYQDAFYQWMFLFHAGLGLLLVVPFLTFALAHLRRAHTRPNRHAVRAGYALFGVALLLLASGIGLLRLEGMQIHEPFARALVYWLHVAAGPFIAWLFVLHRLAGPAIRWRIGVAWGGFALTLVGLLVAIQAQDPRQWNVIGPASGTKYFLPSLARTATGSFIPARALMQDDTCAECHPDVHARWSQSVHRFSSFNNPAYLFSVRETRRVGLERDGDVQASRFCAGCHDPVPFFSGAFDDPDFDDEHDPTAKAGITCSACHAITHINSPRGNADFTIEEPLPYPFAYSDSPALRWLNRALIKAKPELHKKTFLKPLHRTAEFCGTCHKVHIPQALNHYKWLRGQNHYDSHLLSGVSGHGIASFYYPKQATPNCSGCHMPRRDSDDFGAKVYADGQPTQVHDHLFPGANTAIPTLVGLPSSVVDEHRRFLEGSLRVDLFALQSLDGTAEPLHAPLRPRLPSLQPGRSYRLDVVLRTLTLGHAFTQGTADSNEVWLELRVENGQQTIGRSGARAADGSVDAWAHFVNAYVLDRHGRRIDRRNVQDIFVPLYDHQIPPGAADVVHYRLQVPESARGSVRVTVQLQYRKFDTAFTRHFRGDPDATNDLPITTIATDSIEFPLTGDGLDEVAAPDIPVWQRWNDYGIGLLRKSTDTGQKGELRRAEEAFAAVTREGSAEGALNLARLYLHDGRLAEAERALANAARHDPPAAAWSVAWWRAQLDREQGNLDAAIAGYDSLLQTPYAEARARGFDFSRDYRILLELGEARFERARNLESEERERALERAWKTFEQVLVLDPENLAAHYNLAQIATWRGRAEEAVFHREEHSRYRPDDNARDQATAIHRSTHPAADHAAEAVALYELR